MHRVQQKSLEARNRRWQNRLLQTVSGIPQWLTSFFPKLAELDELKTKSVSAVYVLPVETEDGIRLFTLPFGYGRTMLDDSCYVKKFLF